MSKLNKIIQHNDPKLDLSKFHRCRGDKRTKLQKLYWLCFLNSLHSENSSLHQKYNVYGKIFFDHYALLQTVRDNFQNHYSQNSDEISNLLNSIQKDLKRVDDFFQKRTFIPTHFVFKPDSLKQYDLKKNDKNIDRDIIPGTYSKLLLSMLDNLTENTSVFLLQLDPMRKRFKKTWLPKIEEGYQLILIKSVIDEYHEQINKYGSYHSRSKSFDYTDAVRDFFEQQELDQCKRYTAGQIGYLIQLSYQDKSEKRYTEKDRSDITDAVRLHLNRNPVLKMKN